MSADADELREALFIRFSLPRTAAPLQERVRRPPNKVHRVSSSLLSSPLAGFSQPSSAGFGLRSNFPPMSICVHLTPD